MIQAVLTNSQHPEYGVVTVPFPIPREEYDHVMELLAPLEIGDPITQDCHIEEINGDFPALKQLEQMNANLDEIDYLAKRLDSFDNYEKAQFQGIKFSDGEMYAHLWSCNHNWSIKTEQELFSHMHVPGADPKADNQAPQMGGMTLG